MDSEITTKDILAALRYRHKDRVQWVYVEELQVSIDWNWRRIDAWAMNCFRCNDFKCISYEIKVSRSDFSKELSEPSKREPALMGSDEFYFVAPKGMIDAQELPEECGLMEVTVNENGYPRARVKKRAPNRHIRCLPDEFVALVARRVYMTEHSEMSTL